MFIHSPVELPTFDLHPPSSFCPNRSCSSWSYIFGYHHPHQIQPSTWKQRILQTWTCWKVWQFSPPSSLATQQLWCTRATLQSINLIKLINSISNHEPDSVTSFSLADFFCSQFFNSSSASSFVTQSSM